MRIVGSIHKVDLTNRIVGIKIYKQIKYLYFQNALMQLFKRYLYESIYLDVEIDNCKSQIKNNLKVFRVKVVHQVFATTTYNKITYFNKNNLDLALSKFLLNLDNIMILDLEMTMPNYGYYGKEFAAEIIQAGFLLLDSKGNEITRYSQYIYPTISSYLNKRTLDFLKITRSDFKKNAMSYFDFYNYFKQIVQTYHPTIIIYGKNDSIALENSYKYNKVKSLSKNYKYVNLSKLIKNYYNLKCDIGLFKLYSIYYKVNDSQTHDAFGDSYVTLKVFEAFKDDIQKKTDYYYKIREEFEPN